MRRLVRIALLGLAAGACSSPATTCTGAACSAPATTCGDGVRQPGEVCFAPPVFYPTTTAGIRELALGDIDGDGHLDVAVTSSGNVDVFFNDGTGRLLPPVSLAVGVGTRDVAIGDLDGDGLGDVVTPSPNESTTYVYFGAAGRTFSGPVLVDSNDGGRDVALGDMDGDGLLDIVVLGMDFFSGTEDVAVMQNLGNREFGSSAFGFETGDGARNLALGEVDGDGDLDVVTENGATGTLSVLLNDGSGVLAAQPPIAAGTSIEDVVLADVDGDGDLDLLTTDHAGTGADADAVVVLLDDGSGGFSPGGRFPTRGRARSVEAADLDGDGRIDLVTANYVLTIGSGAVYPNVSVLLGESTASYAQPIEVGDGQLTVDARVGDIDGDGLLDVVTSNSGESSIGVLLARP